jgi:hypothetical protein
MRLDSYLRPLDQQQRDAFALQCRTTYMHLKNVAFSGKLCGIPLAVSIEQTSGGAVTRRELRPADWWLIWPELVDDEHPIPQLAQQA